MLKNIHFLNLLSIIGNLWESISRKQTLYNENLLTPRKIKSELKLKCWSWDSRANPSNLFIDICWCIESKCLAEKQLNFKSWSWNSGEMLPYNDMILRIQFNLFAAGIILKGIVFYCIFKTWSRILTKNV